MLRKIKKHKIEANVLDIEILGTEIWVAMYQTTNWYIQKNGS